MSELIIIGYPDKETAGKVLDELQGLEKDYLIDLDGAAAGGLGGTVFQTSLSHEAEEKLVAALQGEKVAAS